MSEWKKSSLGELANAKGCTIQTGPFGSQLHKGEYKQEGVGVINPTHIKNRSVSHDSVPHVSSEVAERLAKHKVRAGDLLFARRGEIGRHALIKDSEHGWLCGTGCFLVRLNQEVADPSFVSYFLSTDDSLEWLNRHASGVVMPNLSNQVLQKAPVQVPCLEEQKEISRILSTVERAIEAQERIIQTTTELKQALMQKLFSEGLRGEPQKETEIGLVPESWELAPIGDLFETQLGKMLSQKAKAGNTPRPYLRNKNVQWGKIDTDDLLMMDFNDREAKRFALQNGDLLVCEGGEIGRSAIWQGEITECFYQKALHRLRPKSARITNEFMAYWMMFAFLLSNTYGITGTRTTIAHLPEIKLKRLLIPIPSSNERDEIVRGLDSISIKLESHQNKLSQLQDIFRTLLHCLMTQSPHE